jgi:hypothetical protein
MEYAEVSYGAGLAAVALPAVTHGVAFVFDS